MIRSTDFGDEPPLRVMALHALLYCERLFYLEEVEEIRVADANVYSGRRLHLERLPLDDELPEYRSLEVSSETWGLVGKVDAVRKRDLNQVVSDVQAFARRQPTAFLGAAALAGFALVRFLKTSTAGASTASGGTTPSTRSTVSHQPASARTDGFSRNRL